MAPPEIKALKGQSSGIMIRRIIQAIQKPYMVKYYFAKAFSPLVGDRFYIDAVYTANFGKRPNLDAPQTYNEKLQWLKLHDRRPEYARLVDKSTVKPIVTEKVGQLGVRVIPTLKVYQSAEEIDFNALPGSFVLKCTHDSGSVVVCKDRDDFDVEKAIRKLKKALKRNFYYKSREYPYQYIKPQIIAEPYLSEIGEESLLDYKLFCFNGVCKYLFIASDRATEVKFDYFDAQFNRLPIRQKAHPTSDRQFEKPACFETMKQAAEILSQGIPQVRVDFYIIRNQIYFGEMTFFHHGGFVPFIPDEADREWGEQLQLPSEEK